MTDYVDFNSQMWDKWSRGREYLDVPVTHGDLYDQNGELIIYRPRRNQFHRNGTAMGESVGASQRREARCSRQRL